MTNANFSKENKLASFVLAFAPLTEPYRLLGTNLSVLLIIFSSLFLALSKGKKFYINKTFIFFLLYSFLVPVFYGTKHGYTNSSFGFISTIAVFAAAYIIITPKANLSCISHYLRILTNFACIVFLAQEISHLLWGVRFSGLLPFLQLKYDTSSMAEFIQGQINSDRSSSIFLEPSHFAEYISLTLCLEMANNNKNKKISSRYAIFLTFCLVILRSGTGLLIASFCWLFSYLGFDATISKKMVVTIALLLGAAFIIYLGMNTTSGQEMIGRTSELTLDKDYNTSGSKRLFRGYWVFADMPTEAQLLGVTTDGLVTAIDNSSARALFTEGSYFLNNMHLLLIGTGILGTFLFFLSIFRGYSMIGFRGRILLWCFFILCMIEGFLFTTKMLLYMSLLEIIKINNCNNNGSVVISNKAMVFNAHR